MITSKTYFNPDGTDILSEQLYVAPGSPDIMKPTGFIDFNRPKYQWSKNVYDLLIASFWTMGEVNTNTESKNFQLLSDNEQSIYQYTFGQLSLNDSVQSFYLTDFQKKANNSIVRAALIKQAETEVLHSGSYATLLDATGVSNEVFDLYKTDEALMRKNQRIAELFAKHINGNSADEFLYSAIASVCLEGIFFLTGFSFIYAIGDKVPGARDTIAFINRDENIHLVLFANIAKTIAREHNLSSAKYIDEVYAMIREAVDIELEYGLYLLEKFPILGLTKELIVDTVHNYANERLKAIGLDPIYPIKPKTNLQKLVDKGSDLNSVRTNFFEGNVANYAKDSINMDDF
jgi:ribonucleoside-diphosphate reductase beta chain